MADWRRLPARATGKLLLSGKLPALRRSHLLVPTAATSRHAPRPWLCSGPGPWRMCRGAWRVVVCGGAWRGVCGAWCLLVPAGAYWCLLVPAGARCRQMFGGAWWPAAMSWEVRHQRPVLGRQHAGVPACCLVQHLSGDQPPRHPRVRACVCARARACAWPRRWSVNCAGSNNSTAGPTFQCHTDVASFLVALRATTPPPGSVYAINTTPSLARWSQFDMC